MDDRFSGYTSGVGFPQEDATKHYAAEQRKTADPVRLEAQIVTDIRRRLEKQRDHRETISKHIEILEQMLRVFTD